jgi:hypothetical protein
MIEFLKMFNHPCLPEQAPAFDRKLEVRWKSPPLDVSGCINRSAGKVASFIRHFVHFKQKAPFQVEYRCFENSAGEVEIQGEVRPDMKVWGGYKISVFCRNVKFQKRDYLLIEDRLSLEIRNRRGMGGTARMSIMRKGD